MPLKGTRYSLRKTFRNNAKLRRNLSPTQVKSAINRLMKHSADGKIDSRDLRRVKLNLLGRGDKFSKTETRMLMRELKKAASKMKKK